MDVRERVEPGPAATRCPYCHDLLAVDAAQVECGGCGTRHHAVCLEELGRCTVMGCAWAPGGRAPPPPPTRPTEVVRRAIHERTRRRLDQYVASTPRAPAPPTVAPPTWEEEERRVAADRALEALRSGTVSERAIVAIVLLNLLILSGVVFIVGLVTGRWP